MNSKAIKETLKTIEGGEYFDIFNLLPEVAGGEAWTAEVKDCARSMSEWLDDEKDYDIDDLRDLGGQWANSECEDYYNNINTRVQSLSLWASNDLDAEVEDLTGGGDSAFSTLTALQSVYLYCAMRQLWDAVADQGLENTEEREEVDA
jgi:hypothetical protein